MSVEQTVGNIQQTDTSPIEEKRHIKSRGEKIFDWFTYGGIATLGTFIATLPIAYWLRYSNDRRGYEWGIRQLGKLNVTGKRANTLVTTTILSGGGTAILLPVGIAEHYKIPIVRGLNAMLNEPPDVDIKAAPKQTVGSLIKGRIVAFATVWAGFSAAEIAFKRTFDTFQDEFGELTCKVFGKQKHNLSGITTPKSSLTASRLEKLETRTYRYGKLGALDIFATITSGILLYLGSRFFAKRSKERREHKEMQTQQSTQHRGIFAHQAERVEEKPAPAPDAPSLKINEIQHQTSLAKASEPMQISPS